ncbi:succinate dehydrogenase, hydrophobic membrane anchor protein [Caulobacter sp. 17J80-11]|uniref:succinate dehydrogenase, hydrophobic membrane anchor protein n=1 Tax=Caulobacter sp. 17J80-11 TaxID=2763502 RepID=UPI00351BFB1A
MSFETDKKKVEGLGSAHHGAGVWIKERVSSLILVPLTVWGLWGAWTIANTGYDGAWAFVRNPINAALLAVTVLVSIYHMHLGMRVVIEDYLHKTLGKGLSLFLNFVVCAALAVATVISILMVAFGGFGV